MGMTSTAITQQLRDLLGTGAVSDDPATLADYGTDRALLAAPHPACVVFPHSTEEVRALIDFASRNAVPLVPSGGRTGLSGGALAAHGEVVVSLERMNRLLALDPLEHTLTVEAGMITAAVQQHAHDAGLFYGVDFASSGSSHIGGNVATNAGGIRVIRYGMTRDQVRGLRVVDGRAEIMDLNRGLVKNNTGPDLRHLFIGSEGILGIVTEVTLMLHPSPGEAQVLFLAVPDFTSILDILQAFAGAFRLNAFEFLGNNGLERVLQALGLARPTSSAAPFYVLVEFEEQGNRDAAVTLVDRLMSSGSITDGVIASSTAQADTLWRLREAMSGTLARWHPYKNDLSLRIPQLHDFMQRAQQLIEREYSGFEVVWYGHVGDGNLHLNVLRPPDADEARFSHFCDTVSTHVAALIAAHGGSVSAEHGVGLLKKHLLGYTRSPAEITALRGIRRIFDPHGIMNPGKVFDP